MRLRYAAASPQRIQVLTYGILRRSGRLGRDRDLEHAVGVATVDDQRRSCPVPIPGSLVRVADGRRQRRGEERRLWIVVMAKLDRYDITTRQSSLDARQSICAAHAI
jgi:hypothetical protein